MDTIKEITQRTKEIGIRKVLGARATGLWALLSADFIKLVLLPMLIAVFSICWIKTGVYTAGILKTPSLRGVVFA